MNKSFYILCFLMLPALSFSQNLVGKWIKIKSVAYAETNNKEASKIIYDYIDSFLQNDYNIYMIFSENGRYTEYSIGSQVNASYKTDKNKLHIYNSNSDLSPTFNIKNDTLILNYNHTKNYDSDRLRRLDVPDYESVKVNEAGQYIYLKKLPDDYAIIDSIYKRGVDQGIIMESKYPDKVKEDILGEWIYLKTEPVVMTNNKNTTLYLEGVVEMTVIENKSLSKPIIFDKDSVYQNYRMTPYSIDKNIEIKFDGKKSKLFAINDSILTIEEDLREALIWIGIGVSDDPITVKKFAARTYYKKYVRPVTENPHYKETMEDLWAFIHKNLQYPQEALKNKIEGVVIVFFMVHEDGSISDINIHESIHPDLDAEAIRIAKLTSGSWIPKMENEVPVAGFVGIGVKFKLPESHN